MPVVLIILLIILTTVAFLVNRKISFRVNSFFGMLIHLIFVGIGITVFTVYNQKPVFYNRGVFYAEILEILQEKPNSYQSVLSVRAVKNGKSVVETDEKVMAYFGKNENAQKLEPGETILFRKIPQLIKNRGNPFEFDYQGYLAGRKIYRQVYLPDESWEKTDRRAKFAFSVLAERTRLYFLRVYEKYDFGEDELHVLSALTLGYKRGLDPEIKRIFSSAGAMHVLAVSGLHVGIVFLVLSFLLRFLTLHKTGRVIYVFIVILALWCFAFITGLSPSVQRAATMFSFVVVGENIKRQSSIYNTLASSAFFLLLLNPNNLFEAGFQLSYAAVFGIVFLQPKLVQLFHFKEKVFQYGWELLTVSVAAQVATFPLTAFYFGQFPSYFWLTNLVVIPAVMFLIPLGLTLLIFHWVPVLSELLAGVAGCTVNTVIRFLRLVEEMPWSVAEFSMSVSGVVILTAALFALSFFMETKLKKYFKLTLLIFAVFAAFSFIAGVTGFTRKEIIVYNQPDFALAHFINGKKNYVVSDRELNEATFALNLIQNTVQKMRLEEPVFLVSIDNFHDSFFYLKNGRIVFNGKVIAFKVAPGSFPETASPEIAIDSDFNGVAGRRGKAAGVIVSSERYSENHMAEDFNVFYLNKEGAFRKKW